MERYNILKGQRNEENRCDDRRQTFLNQRWRKRSQIFDAWRGQVFFGNNRLNLNNDEQNDRRKNLFRKLHQSQKIKRPPKNVPLKTRPFVVGTVKHKIYSPPFLHNAISVFGENKKKKKNIGKIKSFAPSNHQFKPPENLKRNFTPLKESKKYKLTPKNSRRVQFFTPPKTALKCSPFTLKSLLWEDNNKENKCIPDLKNVTLRSRTRVIPSRNDECNEKVEEPPIFGRLNVKMALDKSRNTQQNDTEDITAAAGFVLSSAKDILQSKVIELNQSPCVHDNLSISNINISEPIFSRGGNDDTSTKESFNISTKKNTVCYISPINHPKKAFCKKLFEKTQIFTDDLEASVSDDLKSSGNDAVITDLTRCNVEEVLIEDCYFSPESRQDEKLPECNTVVNKQDLIRDNLLIENLPANKSPQKTSELVTFNSSRKLSFSAAVASQEEIIQSDLANASAIRNTDSVEHIVQTEVSQNQDILKLTDLTEQALPKDNLHSDSVNSSSDKIVNSSGSSIENEKISNEQPKSDGEIIEQESNGPKVYEEIGDTTVLELKTSFNIGNFQKQTRNEQKKFLLVLDTPSKTAEFQPMSTKNEDEAEVIDLTDSPRNEQKKFRLLIDTPSKTAECRPMSTKNRSTPRRPESERIVDLVSDDEESDEEDSETMLKRILSKCAVNPSIENSPMKVGSLVRVLSGNKVSSPLRVLNLRGRDVSISPTVQKTTPQKKNTQKCQLVVDYESPKKETPLRRNPKVKSRLLVGISSISNEVSTPVRVLSGNDVASPLRVLNLRGRDVSISPTVQKTTPRKKNTQKCQLVVDYESPKKETPLRISPKVKSRLLVGISSISNEVSSPVKVLSGNDVASPLRVLNLRGRDVSISPNIQKTTLRSERKRI